MTKLLIAAAAGLAVAGAASAQLQVFSIDNVNSGNVPGGLPNAGLSIDGTFNQDPLGGDTAPNPALVGAVPSLIEDSYVAMGGEPITSTSSIPSPVLGFADFEFNDSSISGTWITFLPDNPAELSDEVGGEFDIFIGRFVGGSISGELSFGNLNEGSGDLGQFVLNLDGTPNAPADAVQDYALRVDVSNGNAGQINDVYIEAIPAPGAAGLLGFAGLAAARRRR